MPKITLKQLWRDTLSTITNIDKGFWPSSWHAIFAPGVYAKSFMDGQTNKWYSPVRLAIIWGALSVFVSIKIGVFQKVQQQASNFLDTEQNATNTKIQQLAQEYSNFLMLLMVPFIAFILYKMHKKRNITFGESLIIVFITLSGGCIFSLFSTSFIYFQPQWSTPILSIGFMFNIFLLAYAQKTIFDLSWWKSMLQGSFQFILGYLSFIVFSGILGILTFLLLFLLGFSVEK